MRRTELLVYVLAAGLGLTTGVLGTRWAAAYATSSTSDEPAAIVTSSRSPEPLRPAPEQWEEMVSKMEHLSIRHNGRVAIYLKDLRGGREWTYHPDDLFPSASLIKLPVMACVFNRMKEGGLTLDTPMTLRRRERVGGSGRLKWAADGTRYTVREVLERMITESDNTAMRMLLDEVGFDYFARGFTGNLGLTYTQIHPEGLSLDNRRIPNENYTTAREMGGLLERMYHGQLVDRFSSEMMLEYMKGLKTRKRLARALPVGWQLAHKTGLLRGACHDVGIVMTPQGEYVLAVLTGQNASYKDAKDFIEKLAATSYRYMRLDSDIARANVAPAAIR